MFAQIKDLTRASKPQCITDDFKLYFTPEIVQVIVKYANMTAAKRNLNLENEKEIYAFIYLLLLIAENFDTELHIRHMVK